MGHNPLTRAMTLVIPILMILHWPHLALAQSSTTARNPLSTSTTLSPSTTIYNGIPTLVFGSVPTMTACASGLILFNLYNEDPSKVNITLYAINEGIDQSIPSPATTSAIVQSSRPASSVVASTQIAIASSPLPTSAIQSLSSARPIATSAVGAIQPARRDPERRTILDLNITLVTQGANHGWSFNPVRLPEGRYYISGLINDGRQTTNKSNVFSVVENEDTSCLSAFESLSASATASRTGAAGGGMTGKTTATATASDGALGGGSESATEGTEKKGLNGGAVGGIVIGILGGLAILALLLFCCRRRRGYSHSREHGSEEGGFMGTGIRHQSHHQKMPSENTTPSDQGHQGVSRIKEPIAMLPVSLRTEESHRSDKTDEKGESSNSINEDGIESLPNTFLPTPISAAYTTSSTRLSSEDNHNVNEFGKGQSESNGIDPFITPTLSEIPIMSPIYANEEIRQLGHSSIQTPQPVILANVKRSSAEENVKPAIGLGIGGTTLKSSNSLMTQQSRSDPGKKRTSLNSLGVRSPTQISPDPNSFGIPDNRNDDKKSGMGLGRSTSSRRKPVPSLGPELRTELARQNSLKDLKGNKTNENDNVEESGRRRSYKLMPDPPIIQE
ncbi:uncharacterized protein I206_101900 [Kwoniella pini CBS 10737]|uniref:Mid2 domain-containing protein n=1 Tax=Kwoniella pini CBS 10737 TaxID=1296096 RepID=A0A1B9HVE2_9TREE|nr:uncharacterized protein I206_07009 [Kwoniella pini CBS 10737]OCF47231.1 hypothetical protein I206_07009 [Kwoniella pini CBS 10737]